MKNQMRLNKIKRSQLFSGLLATVTISYGFNVIAQQTEAVEQQPTNNQVSNKFDLFELRVNGNTALDKQTVERTLYPFLGKQKSIDSVEQARQALENIYHTKGYQTISVDIPEQNVVNGLVYLHVNEGKVARLRVTDAHYFSLGAIKEKVPELAEGSIPNLPQMQQQLTELAKQSPDRVITPVLRAGETPGTLDVDLKVDDKLPLHGKLELNGRNTTTTERLRSIASFHYDNLWQKFHSASFMYQTTPENPNQLDVIVGSYAMPIFDADKRLAFFVVSSSSNTNSISNVGSSTIVGNGRIYGLRFIDPIATKIKNLYQTFTAGASYKDNMQYAGSGGTATPYSYLPFTLGYTGNLQNPDSQLNFAINGIFSIRGLGNTENQFTSNGNINTRSDFAYINSNISFNHNLPYDMEFASRFSGQVTNTPLLPYERFSIGGQQSVRGYYETQLLMDNGVQGSLELYSPKLHIDDWPEHNKIRALVFVDAGTGWVTTPPSAADKSSNLPGLINTEAYLASAGAGFRMQLWKTLTANFDVGVPFDFHVDPLYTPAYQFRVKKGTPRLHFQVFTEF